MGKIVTIENDRIKADISTLGAEIIKMTVDGEDVIWSGDPTFWNGHAPVLFPICSRLVNGCFKFEGKKYDSFALHGFARKSEFEVLTEEKSSVVFSLLWNEETLKAYPFKFELKINYVLSGDQLKVFYIVENHDNREMYFNIGAHEAYKIDGNIEDYSIEFEDENEYIDFSEFEGSLLTYEKKRIMLDEGKLHLNYDYFYSDDHKTREGYNSPGSILLENHKSRRFNLIKNDDYVLSIYANDFKYLVLWTVPGAGFIAIEPWDGITDRIDFTGELNEKEGISSVKTGESKIFYHSITF